MQEAVQHPARPRQSRHFRVPRQPDEVVKDAGPHPEEDRYPVVQQRDPDERPHHDVRRSARFRAGPALRRSRLPRRLDQARSLRIL